MLNKYSQIAHALRLLSCTYIHIYLPLHTRRADAMDARPHSQTSAGVCCVLSLHKIGFTCQTTVPPFIDSTDCSETHSSPVIRDLRNAHPCKRALSHTNNGLLADFIGFSLGAEAGAATFSPTLKENNSSVTFFLRKMQNQPNRTHAHDLSWNSTENSYVSFTSQ